MRRIATVIAAIVLLLVVASQLALPPLAERAVAGRLTKDGGSADVMRWSARALFRSANGEGGIRTLDRA